MAGKQQKTVVVIGNGMVGHRFCERLVEYDAKHEYQIVTFCEEPRPAYDRVNLTKYFEHREAGKARRWPTPTGTPTTASRCTSATGPRPSTARIGWCARQRAGDRLRRRRPGDRLRAVRAAGARRRQEGRVRLPHHRGPRADPRLRRNGAQGGGDRRRPARPGGRQGGPRPRPGDPRRRVRPAADAPPGRRRRLADAASTRSRRWASRSTSTRTPRKFSATARSRAWRSPTAAELDVDMVVISAGIRPRDELARACGLEVGQRGGVVVDDDLRTSDPDIFAIGEVALQRRHDLRPGRARATRWPRSPRPTSPASRAPSRASTCPPSSSSWAWTSPASATPSPTPRPRKAIDVRRPVRGRLQEAGLQPRRHPAAGRHPGRRRLGIRHAVGCPRATEPLADAARASCCSASRRAQERRRPWRPSPTTPRSARATTSARARSATPSATRSFARREVKACTKAGTGCGGCLPLVTDLLKAELKAAGKKVNNPLCEHFACTPPGTVRDRQDQADQDVRRPDRARTAAARAARSASRPSPRSWRASGTRTSSTTPRDPGHQRPLPGQHPARRQLYSVVPRVPGGEITPEKLIVLGEVARKYGLYTKITGGQRIDLFGAAGPSPAGHLGGAGRRRLRERPRLRQGGPDGQELRRHDLVPLRRAGLGRVRHPGREPLPGRPRAAQAQGGRLGLRPRMRRGPEQGLRPDRHRKGLEPLRLRQRRRQAAARRPARRRPRRGDRHQVHRPVPDVLHPDGRPADAARRSGSRRWRAGSSTSGT